MSCIFEWDGYYYEYSSFQVEPYEVSINVYEDLWKVYHDRSNILNDLMHYISNYNSGNLNKDLELNLEEKIIKDLFDKLKSYNNKLKELKDKYNLVCNDSPKIIPLNDPNLRKKALQYKWICRNCDEIYELSEEDKLKNNKAIKNGEYEKIFLCPKCGSNEVTKELVNTYLIEKSYQKAKKSFNNNNLEEGIKYGTECIKLYNEIDELYDKEKIDVLQCTISTIYRWVSSGYSDLKKQDESYKIANDGIKEINQLDKYNRRIIYYDLIWLHLMRLYNVTKKNSQGKEDLIISDHKKVIEYIDKTEDQIMWNIKNELATENDLIDFRNNKDKYILQAYYYSAIGVGEICGDVDMAQTIAKKGYNFLQFANIEDQLKNQWEIIYNDFFSAITSIKIASQQEKDTKGCFIATAIYHSYDCPQVWTLRRFRDHYLMNRKIGKLFVKTYYKISPIIVQLFGNKNWFNKIFKSVLDKFIVNLKNRGYDDTVYEDN